MLLACYPELDTAGRIYWLIKAQEISDEEMYVIKENAPIGGGLFAGTGKFEYGLLGRC